LQKQTLYRKSLQSIIVAKHEKIKKVAGLALTETKKKEKIKSNPIDLQPFRDSEELSKTHFQFTMSEIRVRVNFKLSRKKGSNIEQIELHLVSL
jgi:hypothetical protein